MFSNFSACEFQVIIGAEYGPSADIWSVACVAYELATGRFLFSAQADEKGSVMDNHVALIEALLGPAPKHLALAGHLSKGPYSSDGRLRASLRVPPVHLQQLLTKEAGLEAAVAGKFAEFLEFLLQLDWNKRPSALDALQHPWMKI